MQQAHPAVLLRAAGAGTQCTDLPPRPAEPRGRAGRPEFLIKHMASGGSARLGLNSGSVRPALSLFLVQCSPPDRPPLLLLTTAPGTLGRRRAAVRADRPWGRSAWPSLRSPHQSEHLLLLPRVTVRRFAFHCNGVQRLRGRRGGELGGLAVPPDWPAER